ncbi:MAG: hypothetical protein AB1782_05060 [Cyanobacteriota bacterium]
MFALKYKNPPKTTIHVLLIAGQDVLMIVLTFALKVALTLIKKNNVEINAYINAPINKNTTYQVFLAIYYYLKINK